MWHRYRVYGTKDSRVCRDLSMGLTFNDRKMVAVLFSKLNIEKINMKTKSFLKGWNKDPIIRHCEIFKSHTRQQNKLENKH